MCPANPAVPEIKEENPESSRMCVRPPRSVEIPLFFFFFRHSREATGPVGSKGGEAPQGQRGPRSDCGRRAPQREHTHTRCNRMQNFGRGGVAGGFTICESLSLDFFFGCLTVLLNSAKSTHTENRTFVYRCSCFIGFITYCFLILKFYVQFCSLVSQ